MFSVPFWEELTQTPVHLTTVFILPCHLNEDNTEKQLKQFSAAPQNRFQCNLNCMPYRMIPYFEWRGKEK